MKQVKIFCLFAMLACSWVALKSPVAFARFNSQSNAVNFERDIRPLLHARCSACHGATKQMAGLRFDQKASALKVITAGKSDASELIRRVTSNDKSEMMPPKGERLTPREIALLKAWIDAGATWPETETAASKRADQTWWSLHRSPTPNRQTQKTFPPRGQSPRLIVLFTRNWLNAICRRAHQLIGAR